LNETLSGKLGAVQYANTIRRRTPRLGDKWHMDEMVITIKGEKHFLWRAVDQDGFVLDVLVQKRRNTKAAKRFMRTLLRGQGCSARVMVSDKLRSYGAAKRELGMSVCEHRAHKGLNNRIENSHRLSRKREKIMGRFKSLRQAQRFLSAHDQVNTIFRPRRYNLTAISYRHARTDAFALWRDYTAEMNA